MRFFFIKTSALASIYFNCILQWTQFVCFFFFVFFIQENVCIFCVESQLWPKVIAFELEWYQRKRSSCNSSGIKGMLFYAVL